MLLHVRVKPGSPKPGFSREGGELVLRVRERAIEGEANAACVRAIAHALGIPQSRVSLIHGARSRYKSFNIEGVGAAQLDAIG